MEERLTAFIVLFLFAITFSSSVVAQRNEIVSLPGAPQPLNFRQFSGEIIIEPMHGKRLFYWFVQSQNRPATDPVVLWLNGGPGCSSLIGLLTENGPFIPDVATNGASLVLNPHSWNRVANVLYLETPAGVGFSYSNNVTDYNTDNQQTALDNFIFIRKWFELFPEFQANDFWITGESYAGDYVPQLALHIIEGDDLGLAKRFKGIMLGNPCLDCPEMKVQYNNIQVETLYYHGAIPYKSLQEWRSSGCVGGTRPPNPKCDALVVKYIAQAGPQFDPDNLYTDICTGNATLDISQRNPNCITIQSMRDHYLNMPQVQKAIFAHPTNWQGCSNINYTTTFPNQMPYYQLFFELRPDLRILIYSGDVDIATVPQPITQLCLSTLNRPTKREWTPWMVNGIVAGYLEEYDRYTFVSLKGAGHEAPTFTPLSAYVMFDSFLHGRPLA